MLTRIELKSPYDTYTNKGHMMTEYEEQFADYPEWVTTRQAAKILDVTSIQGVHYIIDHLPENAPDVQRDYIELGKAKILRLSKSDLIELRLFRDKN